MATQRGVRASDPNYPNVDNKTKFVRGEEALGALRDAGREHTEKTGALGEKGLLEEGKPVLLRDSQFVHEGGQPTKLGKCVGEKGLYDVGASEAAGTFSMADPGVGVGEGGIPVASGGGPKDTTAGLRVGADSGTVEGEMGRVLFGEGGKDKSTVDMEGKKTVKGIGFPEESKQEKKTGGELGEGEKKGREIKLPPGEKEEEHVIEGKGWVGGQTSLHAGGRMGKVEARGTPMEPANTYVVGSSGAGVGGGGQEGEEGLGESVAGRRQVGATSAEVERETEKGLGITRDTKLGTDKDYRPAPGSRGMATKEPTHGTSLK